MMKKHLQPFLLAVLGVFACLPAARAQTLPDTLLFTLNGQNNICVRARLNDADTLLLMFHSSNTGVTLTQEAAAKMTALKAGQSTKVTTWGGTADAQFSENNTLTISRLRWDSLTVFIDENSGPGTDGKFGYDLFGGKVVLIDYDRSRMIVYPDLPRLPGGYRRSKLVISDGSTYIAGALKIGKTVYRDTFMFHTGYGGAVLLDPAIGERYAMQASLPTISVSQLTDAFGNVFKIETKRLPELRVGGRTLKNVPLSFAARPSAIPMKVFGNGLLKRFNVVFDFRRNEVYMKPNGYRATPF